MFLQCAVHCTIPVGKWPLGDEALDSFHSGEILEIISCHQGQGGCSSLQCSGSQWLCLTWPSVTRECWAPMVTMTSLRPGCPCVRLHLRVSPGGVARKTPHLGLQCHAQADFQRRLFALSCKRPFIVQALEEFTEIPQLFDFGA